MTGWISTQDTARAAAFGTLGVPLELRSTMIEATSKLETRFYLGPESACGTYQTGRLMHRYNSGELERQEPGHPLLTILRGMMNRVAILDLQNQGKFCGLVRVPGTEVWCYAPSREGLPGASSTGWALKTNDVKAVAALGVAGMRLLKIEGSGHHRLYFVEAVGPEREDGLPRADGAGMLKAWNADKESVPWEESFAQAARGLFNRQRLIEAMREDVPVVLVIKPRSKKYRSGLVRADAGQAAWDKLKKHFDRE